MHRAISHCGVLYVNGMFAADTSAGMQGQTADALGRIAPLLTSHGSSKAKVLAATAYVTAIPMKA